MASPTDFTPRDWAAVLTIAASCAVFVAAVARWAVSGAIAKRFEAHETETSKRWALFDGTMMERLSIMRAAIDAAGQEAIKATKEASMASGYAQRGAEFVTLEFERTRETLVDIGKALHHEMKQLKDERISPLEDEVRDMRENGCALAKMRAPKNGGQVKEPCP